jgi:hypothetical protein
MTRPFEKTGLKGILAVLAALLLAMPVFGSEGGENGREEVNPIGRPVEELRLFVKKLGQPEYIHVLLNPIPVYFTAAGALALGLALWLRNGRAQICGLAVIALGCAMAGPVVYFGDAAYDRVSTLGYDDAKQWLNLHAERAETFQYVFYATALVAVLAIIAHTKWPRAVARLTKAALVLALCSVITGGWIGHAGGAVRHSEFRDGPPPGAATPAAHR